MVQPVERRAEQGRVDRDDMNRDRAEEVVRAFIAQISRKWERPNQLWPSGRPEWRWLYQFLGTERRLGNYARFKSQATSPSLIDCNSWARSAVTLG
jgi:hypothetical protein